MTNREFKKFNSDKMFGIIIFENVEEETKNVQTVQPLRSKFGRETKIDDARCAVSEMGPAPLQTH